MIDLFQTWSADFGISWLITITVCSSGILSFACLANWALKKSSAARRFCVWQTAFVGLLMIPIGLAVFPKVPLGLGSQITAKVQHGSLNNFAITETRTALPNEIESPMQPAAASSETTNEIPEDNSATQQTASASVTTESHREPAAISLPSGSLFSQLGWEATLVGVWLLGSILMLARILRSSWLVVRMRARSSDLHTDGKLHDSIESLRFGDRCPTLCISPDISIPITLGIFNPCILLPETANTWKVERLRMVLKHEMAHVDRRDVIWQVLSSIAKSLFWFHPLAWHAERKMQLERERACDDQVITRDEDACDYASILLGFSAELSGKSQTLVGALSMAQKPLESRLETILEPLTPRNLSSKSFRWMVGGIFSAILIAGCVLQPFADRALAETPTADLDDPISNAVSIPFEPIHSSSETEELGPVDSKMPDKLIGRVVNHAGEPVANARVEFSIDLSKRGSNDRIEPVKLAPATTNEAGEYTLVTKDLEAPHGSYLIQGELFAERLTRLRYGYRISDLKSSELPVAKFVEAKEISGRVLGVIQGEGKVVVPINARVRGGNDEMQQFWRNTVNCENDGTFKIYAPAVGITDLIVESDNYAPTRATVAQSQSNVGEITLEQGVDVFGKLVDASGAPAEGVDVKIFKLERIAPSTWSSRHSALSISTIVKTDQQGRFRFPPRNGICSISVVHGNNATPEKPWPILQPKEIDLKRATKPVEVNFVEGKTLLLRGAVRWADGSPQAGVEVSMNSKLGNAYSGWMKCLTDEFGQYQLRFPVGVEEVSVKAPGARNSDGHWHYAYDKKVPIKDSHRSVSMRFKKCDEDIVNADWELRSESRKLRTIPPRKAADFAFDELDKKFGAAWRVAWKEAKEKNEIVDSWKIQLENQDSFVDELMEFEKRYRGEYAALVALNRVISWGVGDSSSKASAASKIAWQIVLDHYVAHKDIDSLINSLFQSLNDPTYQEFVERVKNENPHDHVQARILFSECDLHSSVVAHFYRHREANQRQRSPEAWVNFLKTQNLKRSQKRIRELASEISSKYPEVESSYFVSSTLNGYLWYERHYNRDAAISTFAKMAKLMLFQVEKLAPGKPAPQILGKDVEGQPFRLSDFNGKVVLLTFSASWGDPESAYKALRELQAKHAKQPLEIVSVLMDRKLSDAKKPVDDGEITWQTVWDGKDRPIATQWNERSTPATYYLIDHKGVIRHLSSKRDSFPVLIEQLLEEVPGQ